MSSVASPLEKFCLRDALEKGLRSLESAGGLRAFTFEGITCVISWHPAGVSGSHEIRLALRSGMTRREIAAMVPDLRLLARTCEHHLREFAREHDLEAPAMSGPPPTGLLGASPTERLRARLDLDKALEER
jgi:hypothetical protein